MCDLGLILVLKIGIKESVIASGQGYQEKSGVLGVVKPMKLT